MDRSLAMTWKVHDPLVPLESWKLNRIVIVSPLELELLTSELVKSIFRFTGLPDVLNRSKNSGTTKFGVLAGEAGGVVQV